MEFVKLEGKNLSRGIFDQLIEMERNCGLEPYSPQMLWECITQMDTFACMDGDYVAGFISLHPSARYLGGGLYIVNLNVAQQYRRQGIATELILAACSCFTCTHLEKCVVLDVCKDNRAALTLYQKLGFCITEETSANGESDVVMAVPLAQLLHAVKTPRLILRLPTRQDTSDGAAIFLNDCVKKTYMVPDLSREAAEKLYERLCKLAMEASHYIRGIYLDGKLIGILNDTEIYGGSIELGWALHPDYHNRGYATEAVCASVEDLFALDYQEVTAGAFRENPASIRVMEKSGMVRQERTETIDYRGQSHTCIYYARRKSE